MRAKAHPGKRRAMRPSLAEAASGSTPRHCLPQEARPPRTMASQMCAHGPPPQTQLEGGSGREPGSLLGTRHTPGMSGSRAGGRGRTGWPCGRHARREARGTASWIHPHKHPRARPSNSQSASSRPHERQTRLSRWESSDTLRPSLRESLASKKNTSQVRGTEGALRPSLHEPLISWGTLQTGAVPGHPQSTTLWVSSPHRRENRGAKRASGMPRSHSRW